MAHLTFSKQSRKLPPPYLPQPQGSMLRKPGFGVWRLNMVVPGKLTDVLFFFRWVFGEEGGGVLSDQTRWLLRWLGQTWNRRWRIWVADKKLKFCCHSKGM